MRTGTGFAAFGIAALVFVGVASAGEVDLKDQVEARLVKAGLAPRTSIEVTTEPGNVVVLSGVVTTLADRRRAEREAAKVACTVDNRLALAAPKRTDLEIEKDVKKAVLGYAHYTVFDSVGVAVKDGNVLLEGSVYRGNRKSDIEERVAGVPGVLSLTSRVAVQHPSALDDRLRVQLVRRIYGSDQVIPFVGANPPVRIVVDRGRVTLTGYVNSRVEQFMIGVTARETLALSVDNQVRLDSDTDEEPAGAGKTTAI